MVEGHPVGALFGLGLVALRKVHARTRILIVEDVEKWRPATYSILKNTEEAGHP